MPKTPAKKITPPSTPQPASESSPPLTNYVYPTRRHWRGLIHMPEFYILFITSVLSAITTVYLLYYRHPESKQKNVSTYQPVGQLTKAIWSTYDGGFFSFRYPPTWQLVESTPQGFEANTKDQSESGKFFTSCRVYLQIPKEGTALVAIDIHDRKGNGGYCWSFGYFFDATKRPISSFSIPAMITVQKWMYPHPNANDTSVQKKNWKGDYFQTYQFLGTSQNVTFGLLNQGKNKEATEMLFDEILSTFTFVITHDASDPTSPTTTETNSKRRADIQTILDAILAFKKENGFYPPGIPQKPTYISSKGAKICSSLVPKYLGFLPVDPSVGKNEVTDCLRSYSTGYEISLTGQTLKITAPYSETEIISVSN